jgi:hypothetical protein
MSGVLGGNAATLAAPRVGDAWARSLPDTPLTREAAELMLRHAPLPLQRHSVRVFLLGRRYAAAHGLRHDEEALFVAAVLHDLGLTAALVDRTTSFTRRGAELVATLLHRHGMPGGRAAATAGAVRMHMRPLPAWAASAEAGLLQVGAWADVVGGLGLGACRREMRALLPATALTASFCGALVRASAGRGGLRLLIDMFGPVPRAGRAP